MRLIDAIPKLNKIIGMPFSSIFSEKQLSNLIIPKGRTGQILELILGLENKSSNIDFEDGELKTNKSFSDGKPKETMFICQISNNIDKLLDKV